MEKNYRRAPWHNYKSRCLYHITIAKSQEAPVFGVVKGDVKAYYGDSDYPMTDSSVVGKIIFFNIKAIPKLHPHIKVLQFAIMPDHIHLLLFVEEELPEAVGLYISRFKFFTKQELQRKKIIGENESIFEPSFHDRIFFPKHRIDVVVNYIRENPRRYLVVRENSNFYIRRDIRLLNCECQIYGNPLILQNPFKEAVVIHRADGPEILDKKKKKWRHLALNGGVIVGGFISKSEKEVLKEILEINGKMILISPVPMKEKEKPAGRLFDLCAEGRLLIIHPYGISKFSKPGREAISRDECLFMNGFAEQLAETTPGR